MMINKNQKGFSAVEAIAIVLVVASIIFIGWFVWQRSQTHTSTVDQAKTTTQSTTSDSTVKEGWTTYTNTKFGFSIDVPKQMLSGYGTQCQEKSTVKDNYGNDVASSPHYVPKQGIVPVAVIGDGNDFYITEQYTYQPVDSVGDDSNHSFAKKCQKVETTATVAHDYVYSNNPRYSLSMLPLSIASVKNEQEITSWAQNKFNDKTIFIADTKPNAGGWQDINLDCNDADDMCTIFNYRYYMRYYSSNNKLVYMQQGQSGHIQTPEGSSYYDQEIFNSFKLL